MAKVMITINKDEKGYSRLDGVYSISFFSRDEQTGKATKGDWVRRIDWTKKIYDLSAIKQHDVLCFNANNKKNYLYVVSVNDKELKGLTLSSANAGLNFAENVKKDYAKSESKIMGKMAIIQAKYSSLNSSAAQFNYLDKSKEEDTHCELCGTPCATQYHVSDDVNMLWIGSECLKSQAAAKSFENAAETFVLLKTESSRKEVSATFLDVARIVELKEQTRYLRSAVKNVKEARLSGDIKDSKRAQKYFDDTIKFFDNSDLIAAELEKHIGLEETELTDLILKIAA